MGLFFAMMPLLGYASSHASVSISTTISMIFAVFVKLAVALAMAFLVARTAVVPMVKLMEAFASPELLQLCALAFCMTVAWASDQMVCPVARLHVQLIPVGISSTLPRRLNPFPPGPSLAWVSPLIY